MNSLKQKNIGLGAIILVSFIVLQVFIGYRLSEINVEVENRQALQVHIIELTELEKNLLMMQLTRDYSKIKEIGKISKNLHIDGISKTISTLEQNLQNGTKVSGLISKAYLSVQRELAKDKQRLQSKTATLDIGHENMIMFLIILFANLLINVLLYYFVQQIIQNIERFRVGLASFFDFLNRKSTSVEPIVYSGTKDFDDISEMVNKNVKMIEDGIKMDIEAVTKISEANADEAISESAISDVFVNLNICIFLLVAIILFKKYISLG